MARDPKKIKSAYDIVQFIGQHLTLKRDGPRFVGLCPFHNESTGSFKVNPISQRYKCFGCGASGDVIDFVQGVYGLTWNDAYDKLEDQANLNITPSLVRNNLPAPTVWEHIIPAPVLPADQDFYHGRYGMPSKVWHYLTLQRYYIGSVCRYDTPDGKEVLPFIYATDGTVSKFMFKGFKLQRPLYNLPALADKPNAKVMLVEGEKAADAAARLFPKTAVLTWPGGTNAILSIDWTPLAGRMVVLCPDNDAPGYAAMDKIYGKLVELGCTVQGVHPPQDAPAKWDWADWTGTSEEAIAYVKANLLTMYQPGIVPVAPEPFDPVIEDLPAPTPEAGDDLPPDIPPAPIQPTTQDDEHQFAFLGWDKSESGKSTYHFYSFDKKAIISSTAAGMTTNFLLELADLAYWEMNFKGDKKGLNLHSAVDYLIRRSDAQGPFYPSIRGRGAWIDRGRVVLHNGPYLLVDGERVELQRFKSSHIYENAHDMGLTLTEPISSDKCSELLRLVKQFNWERSISPDLLLGWCMLAPVCGALKWRPHIWLTGPSGSGKSWVFLNVVRRLLEGCHLAVQGNSSEAGLRQSLGNDAMPVVFDEAEQENKEAAAQIDRVLALMRTASSDDGGDLIKGSANGSARTFKIRSCFAYASIVPQMKMQADRTRISILALNKREGEEERLRFDALSGQIKALMTDEFVHGLRSRTIKMLPTILKNISVFRSAATAVLGDARGGDQIGTLMGGAFSLVNDFEADFEVAQAWIESFEWTDERGLSLTKDEITLMNFLLERTERIESTHGAVTRTIGELIKSALGITSEGDGYDTLEKMMAAAALNRYGIKIYKAPTQIFEEAEYPCDGFLVSNQSTKIKDWLKDTPWGSNWGNILKRLPGAIPTGPVRFASGVQSRSVFIPVDLLK